MKNKFFILLIIFSFAMSGAGTNAGEWLELDTGLRSIGMATAQVAAGRGISATAYNPANLAFINKQNFFFNKTNYIVDMSHVYIGYARPVDSDEFIGFNVFMFDSGDIPETHETGLADEQGEAGYFKVSNFLFKAVYARNIGDQLKVGASLKYIREDIADMYMQGIAFDIGANYSIDLLGLMFGASITNFGPEVSFEGQGVEIPVDPSDSAAEVLARTTDPFPLPTTIRVGVESQLMGRGSEALIDNDLLNLSIAFDGVRSMDSYFYSSLGAEFGFADMLFARAGVYMGHDTKKLSFGLGLKYNQIKIDYAFTNYGVLGSTNQWGVALEF